MFIPWLTISEKCGSHRACLRHVAELQEIAVIREIHVKCFPKGHEEYQSIERDGE